MSKRRERRVETPLPRPEPSAKFLATGPANNATARRRIASAGAKVVASGKWPTLELVLAKDHRIRPATLDRNSDALDVARSSWITAQGEKLVDAGEFPTIRLLQPRAPTVRRSMLARFEDALDAPRRRWIKRNGPHPSWTDEEPADLAANENAAKPASSDTARGSVLEEVKPGDDVSDRAKRQLERLLKERRADRAEIRDLRIELAETKEALRRANLGVRKKHAVQLNMPSTSTRS
jgi:hypothetical protein